MTKTVILTYYNFGAILERMNVSKEGETRDEVFGFIVCYKIIYHGNTPSLEQISDGCKLSGKSHAKHHVDNLVDEGRITIRRINKGRIEIDIPGARWVRPEGEG